MKKLFGLIPLIILLLLVFSPLLPINVTEVEAANPVIRISPYTTVQNIGTEVVNGIPRRVYRASVSSLPQTLSDLRTPITCQWTYSIGSDNIPVYISTPNTYAARVTGTRVTIEYNGKQAAWDPTIIVGAYTYSATSGPTVVGDLYNSNYKLNTIKWEYHKIIGSYTSPSDYITRYLRQIEGELQEFYTVTKDPGGTLTIQDYFQDEDGFVGDTTTSAHDRNGESINMTAGLDTKIVDRVEFSRTDRSYPYTIDPTVSFTTSASDGFINKYDTSYWSAWTSSSGNYLYKTEIYIRVGQSPGFTIHRGYVYFDTSSLPDDAVISSVSLGLYGQDINAGRAFTVQVQSGMPTYPHDPLVSSDYSKNYYSGMGGTIGSSSITTSGYNNINLNSDGLVWINRSGTTKLCLRSDWDIAGDDTGVYEWVRFYSYEKGAGYQPTLTVTYAIPVAAPVISTGAPTSISTTTAHLYGTLTNDGGADCSVRFKYGTTTSYGTYTPWLSGYVSGGTWDKIIEGLSPGTIYHYTAEATNSAGGSVDSDQTLLTIPEIVTSFTATPGDTSNALAWIKGTGSAKTMIRVSTSSFPTSPSGGTQVYYDTGTSYSNTSLTNGLTYYYSAFSEQSSGPLEQFGAAATASGIPGAATSAPFVTTSAATGVGTTSANLNGDLISLGGYSSSDVWFQYYWGTDTWTDNETTPVTMYATGRITPVAISGLPTSTLIHQRVAATGTGGTTYGSDITFTTGSISAPTISTLEVPSGSISQTSATLYGKVVDDGGAGVTGYFVWGLTASYGNPTGSTDVYLYTDDTFSVPLTGLTIDTTYYFKAIGWNSIGTGKGEDKYFTTLSALPPSVATSTATSVGSTQSILHGTVTGDGGVDCQVRFRYGTDTDYGTSTPWLSRYRSGNNFEQLITGLTTSTAYHFIAEITNDDNVSSYDGTDMSFITKFDPPTTFKATPLSSSSISLSWTPQGDKTLIKYKIGSFPADRLDGYQAYFGVSKSVSLTGLVAGTTYYFRAWSWKATGDYTSTYSEDAATTLAGTAGTAPSDWNLPTPSAPSWFWTGGDDSAIQSWPGVALVDQVAVDMGMSTGAMWTILIVMLCIAMGGFIGFTTGSIPVVLAVVAVIFIITAIIGLLPGWLLVAYLIIGGSTGYVLVRG